MTLITVIFFFCKCSVFFIKVESCRSPYIDCLTLAQLSLALVTFGSGVNYAEYGSSAAAKRASIRSWSGRGPTSHTIHGPRLLQCAGYGARNFLGRHTAAGKVRIGSSPSLQSVVVVLSSRRSVDGSRSIISGISAQRRGMGRRETVSRYHASVVSGSIRGIEIWRETR